MDRRSGRGAICACAVATLACSSPLGLTRDVEAPIQTSRLRYELERVDFGVETEIEYEYTNLTEGPIFIANCGGAALVALEKLVEGEWVGAWGNPIPDCLSPPIVIEPLETITRTLGVFGGDPGCRCAPQFSVENREGIYRIVLIDVLDSFDEDAYPLGAQIDKEERVSNRFRLDD